MDKDQHVCRFTPGSIYYGCDEKNNCPDKERCIAFYWLEIYGFRNYSDPANKHNHLLEPYYEAVEMAWDIHRDENKYKEREKFIISFLKKANEKHALAIESEARLLNKEAKRKVSEAQAIRRSEPRGPNRFPPKWMPAGSLMDLVVFIKKTSKKENSDNLLAELTASKGFTRDDLLAEHYVDKNGKARSRPAALWQVDYQLAEEERGWKKNKVNRLLRQASQEVIYGNQTIIMPLAKLGPRGQIVYLLGYWMTFGGRHQIKWFFTENNGGPEAFRRFRSSNSFIKSKLIQF